MCQFGPEALEQRLPDSGAKVLITDGRKPRQIRRPYPISQQS